MSSLNSVLWYPHARSLGGWKERMSRSIVGGKKGVKDHKKPWAICSVKCAAWSNEGPVCRERKTIYVWKNMVAKKIDGPDPTAIGVGVKWRKIQFLWNFARLSLKRFPKVLESCDSDIFSFVPFVPSPALLDCYICLVCHLHKNVSFFVRLEREDEKIRWKTKNSWKYSDWSVVDRVYTRHPGSIPIDAKKPAQSNEILKNVKEKKKKKSK